MKKMQIFAVFCIILAVAYAKPAGLLFPGLTPLRTSVIAATPIHSQFHSQDILGQYSYGYNNPLSSKGEVKTFDGVTRGSYSYIDADGKLQTVDYTADDLNGFRVAATNIPQSLPVPEQEVPQQIAETPEVAQARASHLAALEEARLREKQTQPNVEEQESAQGQVQELEREQEQQQQELNALPKPVEDTPEVAQAKAEHLEAVKQAEIRNAIAEANEIRITAPNILKAAEFSTVPLLSTLKTATFPATTLLHHPSLPVLRPLNNHAVQARLLPASSLII